MIKPIPQEAYFGVITPSSSLETPEKIRNGLAYLAEIGYHSKIGNFVYGSSNHFSGTPKERASDIMNFFKNPDIAAIIASCGGYGAQSVLPYLDFNIIRQNPKPIIGFSDITALQTAVYTLSGISSIAGIMLKFDFSDNNPAFQTKNSFEKLIIDGQFTPVPAGNTLNSGYAEGVLIGTNFCTLMSLAGTTYFPRLEQKILLLEDIDEKSYRIERLLCQLEQQQGFELVSAIIFGTFSNCALNHPEEKDIESVLDEFAARHPKITMVKHFPFGHTKARICLPIGEKMQLDATSSVPVLQIAHQMK